MAPINCIKMSENVSAGEVCSLEVAERLGIRGGDEYHYNNDFGNVKTYSCYDQDIDKPYHLCTEDGRPSCLVQDGAGFGFRTDPKDINKCITSECPTDFIEKGDKCMKPRTERSILVKNRIDERWYDWFMIPNYHLGNKFDTGEPTKKIEDSVKYNPCPTGTVPHFRIDPVDGTINAGEGEFLDKCVAKSDYFSGKYSDSPDYCPLAWIMRAGATKDQLIKIYRDLIDSIEKEKGPSARLDEIRKSLKNLVNDELFDKIQKEGFDEYAGPADSREIELACRKLSSDTNRLMYAYDICKKIKNRGEKDMIREYENNGMDKGAAKIRYTRACEACHTIFSDPRGAVSQLENKEPIIFEDVRNTYTKIEKEKKELEKEKRKNMETINTDAERDFTLMILVTILGIGVIGLLVFVYLKMRGPIIMKFINWIYNNIIKPFIIFMLKMVFRTTDKAFR